MPVDAPSPLDRGLVPRVLSKDGRFIACIDWNRFSLSMRNKLVDPTHDYFKAPSYFDHASNLPGDYDSGGTHFDDLEPTKEKA